MEVRPPLSVFRAETEDDAPSARGHDNGGSLWA